MPCYRPRGAWRVPKRDGSGKFDIIFGGEHKRFPAEYGIKLACGQCIGCRLERSRRWAVRLMHEASMHDRSAFLTLTYDEDHLPSDGSLQVRDFQLFMKRLRRGSSGPLRFFHCGEYGERTARPHYHVALFGDDFSSDREFLKANERGEPLFTSARLCEAWGNGALEQQTIGELTFESAAYIARYCLKKVTGKRGPAHYAGRRPEYITSSKRPGIGGTWFDRWKDDTYPSDSVVMRGREMMPPPYYDRLLERVDPALFAEVKSEREAAVVAALPETPDEIREVSPVRLRVKEKVKSETVKHALRRRLDNG